MILQRFKMKLISLLFLVNLLNAEKVYDNFNNPLKDSKNNDVNTDNCYRFEMHYKCDSDGKWHSSNLAFDRPPGSWEKTNYVYANHKGSCAGIKMIKAGTDNVYIKNALVSMVGNVKFKIQKRQLFPDGMIQFYYWGYVKNDNTVQDYNEPHGGWSFKPTYNENGEYYIYHDNVKMNIKCQSSILRKGNSFSDYIKIIRIKDGFCQNNRIIDYNFCYNNGDGDY